MANSFAAAASAVALVCALIGAASADPAPVRAPSEDTDNSGTVELLRVADSDVDRFGDVHVGASGRVVGLPLGGPDILINNPAACREAAWML